MSEISQETLIFQIDDVFRLSFGTTVFIGEFLEGKTLGWRQLPWRTQLYQDDAPSLDVDINSIGLGGPGLSPQQSVIEMNGSLPVELSFDRYRYHLVGKKPSD